MFLNVTRLDIYQEEWQNKRFLSLKVLFSLESRMRWYFFDFTLWMDQTVIKNYDYPNYTDTVGEGKKEELISQPALLCWLI